MSDTNKTEKPTAQRRKKARDEGQVARSRELSSTFAWCAALVVIAWQIPSSGQQWRMLLQASLDSSIQEPLTPTAPALFWTGVAVLRWTVPILFAAWLFAVAAGAVQGGVVFAPGALAIKPARLSPTGKLQQMFSLAGLSGVLKSLFPFTAILWVAYTTLQRHGQSVLEASSLSVIALAALLLNMIWEVSWKSGLVLLTWAGVDYLLTWRKLENDLKMSRQEVRDDHKQTEGNPAIKRRIRRLQLQMRRRQMLKDTETANVVVTNPTHYAVALKYEMEMEAPVVVAKGRDYLAQEIKEVARWRGIAIMENPPLAQALYRTVEVGQQIPAALYTAVAEILAFVFRAQAQARQQASRTPQHT